MSVSLTFKFPTAEEITRDWGERCDDFEPECNCCQMWAIADLVSAKDAEIALLREALGKARAQAIDDTLSALTAHELYQYRPKAFRGFIEYAETLKGEANAQLWRAALQPTSGGEADV